MGGGRTAFDAMLAGTTAGRPAWLPPVDELAGRIQSRSHRETTSNPDLWCAGLTRAGELLGADALLVGGDATLAAEACGAELDWSLPRPVIVRRPGEPSAQPLGAPRLAALLEVLRRLRSTARARFGIVAALCGPLLLATQLFPEQAPEQALRRVKAVHTTLVDALLATRPDLLVLRERPAGSAEVHTAWQRAFGTLRNLAAHYDVPLALLAEDWSVEQIAGLGALRLPVYLLGRGSGDALPAARRLATPPVAVGIALSLDAGADPAATLAAVAAARAGGSNLFLTTAPGAGDAPDDLDTLRSLAAQLQRQAA